MKTTNFGPLKIIGIELRTTNDNGKAFTEIPSFWQKFYQEGIIEKIPNKSSGEVYAIYTNFENEGKNNKGMYSLIIGCPVNNISDIPEGFISVIIPESKYAIFESDIGAPEKIGETWQKIWKISDEDKQFDAKRTYVSEFEQYKPSGKITIYIGINDE